MYLNKEYALMRYTVTKGELFMEFYNKEEDDCVSITQSLAQHRFIDKDYFVYKANHERARTIPEWLKFINLHLEHKTSYKKRL